MSISSEELTEWAAYYRLDPFGTYRSDLQAGIVASIVANVNAKKGHTFKPTDFMPTFDVGQESSTMTPQQIHAVLARTFGARPHG